MNEELLHYLWSYKLMNKKLETTNGSEVIIHSPGQRNYDAGPDFFNAIIEIDSIKWAGNIEIHVDASDWFKHKHDNDNTYDNILAHVVYNNDISVTRKNGDIIPSIELKSQIQKQIFNQYSKLVLSISDISCGNELKNIIPITRIQWFEKLAFDRLQNKTQNFQDLLYASNGNFLEVAMQKIARSFGYSVNADAMEQLAKSIGHRIILKHSTNRFQLEALFFGASGLLNNIQNEKYPIMIKAEYEYLKSKYSIQESTNKIWKFMRMRPANFPTIRISQMAGVLHNISGDITQLFDVDNINKLRILLSSNASKYWNTHYKFGNEVRSQVKTLGPTTIDVIILNTIIPLIFFYGKISGKQSYIDKVIKWISEIKAEDNKITRRFKSFGIKTTNATDSQGLIELYSSYCLEKQCLKCMFGKKLIYG